MSVNVGKATPTEHSDEPVTGIDDLTPLEALSFECRVGFADFEPCSTPTQFKLKAKKGKHRISVRAVDDSGNADASPAIAKVKVKRKKKRRR